MGAPIGGGVSGVILYGIRNCDTVRKARAWLDERGIAFVFHDYRIDGVPGERLADWVNAFGWEALLNRAGTTFRKLPEDARMDINCDRAIALMRMQPAMIKRPVLERAGTVTIGFRPLIYERIFPA